MKLIFQPLSKKQALTILNWQYPFPYDYYNFEIDNIEEDLCYLLEEKNAFFAILNLQRELEGYCSFGADGRVPGGKYITDALDIGMGIRPDLVGRGRGKLYAKAVARYGASQYEAKCLRITIAKFNKRAWRVWKQLKFEQVEKFFKIDSKEEFLVMTRSVEFL